jgi:SEC-C motif-containing protein
MQQPGRNDPCHCGSEKKYKHCCLSLDETRDSRIHWMRSAHTLQEKNLALLGAATDIFGLNRPWDQVKKNFSDARICEFHRFVAGLWPVETDPHHILPPPDATLRALYLGENEPEMMVQNVFRFSLYADQILLVNPLPNPNVMAEKYNPILHPGEWRLQTLRLIYQLAQLALWITAGLVIVIPDPGDFDRALRVKTWDLATERLKGWKPGPEDIDQSMMKERTKRSFLLAPREYLERMVREIHPGISDDRVRKALADIERDRANDPLLLDDTLDRMPGQMMVTNMGTNLEMGLYICQATGSFPYTNVRFRWREILAAKDDLDSTAQTWSPLTNAFQQLKFKFLDKVDSGFACTLRKEGRLEGFRSYLRKLWAAVEGEVDLAKAEPLARDFRDELTQAYSEAQAEWGAIDRDLLKWAVPAFGGALVTGAFSPVIAGGLAVAGLNEIIQAEMKRREFRKRVPMSVFIDLEKK